MPRYFKNFNHVLACEALASFLIIESLVAASIVHGTIPDRLARIYINAQNRCSRRGSFTLGVEKV